MAEFGYAQLPVPGGGDAPTTPGHLADLASAIDPHLVQFVADQAERDSLYSEAPAHTVVSALDGTFWKKTSSSANEWATLWEPLPAFRPIELASGIGQSSENAPAIRLQGKKASLQGAVLKTDGTNFFGDAIKLGEVPDDCIPEQLRRFAGTCSLAGDTTDTACRVEVTGKTNATPGDIIVYYQVTAGTPWIDISGEYWLDN
ncbi:hypothetical protein ABZX56_11265 [Streptomyces parvulus]|uniref:hypothetical protein n=1 Tax=Streptomyces parvulus TaxID=146923 RepID=UPI0033B4690A